MKTNPIISTLLAVMAVLTATAAESPTGWQFGSEPERDGDGGFLLTNTSQTNGEWLVEDRSLRFRNAYREDSDERNFTEAAAVIDLREYGWEPGTDFTLSLDLDIEGVSDWNRIGIIAMAPGDMTGHGYGDDGFYHGQLRVQSNRVYHLRISDGFSGDRPLVSLSLPSSIEDGTYRLVLGGAYDEEGGLTLSLKASREDSDRVWFTRTPRIAHPPDGARFGFGGRFKAYPDVRQPVVDFRELRFDPEAAQPPQITADPIRHRGFWTYGGENYPFTATVRQAAHNYHPLPTAVYLRNLDIPRIGTDSDSTIVKDLLDDELVVVELDGADLPAESPAMERALLDFHKNLPTLVSGASAGAIQVDESFIYTLPAGHRLKRNLPFWNIERHGAHGTLQRVLEIYNTNVAEHFGAEPVDSVEDMRGRDGDRFDYNLYIDIIYPSGQATEAVPTIAHFSTLDRMPRMFLSDDRRLYPIGWVTSGYAMALIDHVYHPAARVRYFGHMPGFTLDNWNGVAAGAAGIRFLRAHAEAFNLNGRIGALGHSKSAYTVMRLADPRHPELPEHQEFDGFPTGSPDPQPWPDHKSTIQVAYASMGMGIRRTRYTTPELVPLVVAAGRHDHFDYWNATPEQVARAKEFDLNQLTLWMEELGHTLPSGRDAATGRDRTLLVRHFFDQHLAPLGEDHLEVLAVAPPRNAREVALDGTVARFGVNDEDDLPDNLHGLDPRMPITVRFARSIDTGTLPEDAFSVERADTRDPVPGKWIPSLRNSRFEFFPEEELEAETSYRITVSPGIRDSEGRVLEYGYRRSFQTGP